MMSDDYGGQMIFGDLGGLKLHENVLQVREKPRKNLTQETCPDRGSNPGPLRDKRACYLLSHSGGRQNFMISILHMPEFENRQYAKFQFISSFSFRDINFKSILIR